MLSEVREYIRESTLSYHQILAKSRKAQDILLSRGILQKAWRDYLLGYAPLGKVEPKNKTLMYATGLGYETDEGMVRSLGGRITIPIFDVLGRSCAIAGRAVAQDLEPKFKNTKESPVFVKSEHLFNIHRAFPHIVKSGRAIVVEGYFDAIMMDQVGIREVVAVCGTAFTQFHGLLLKTLCSGIEIIALFDGDEAGNKASIRLQEISTGLKIKSKTAALPDTYDPDDFIRAYGGHAIMEIINSAS